MKVRSPLLWFGGKSKYAEYIISKMPKHKTYVEPFGGAGHVIAQKSRINHEVYNDIDGNAVNFIMQTIERPQELIAQTEQIPYSRELYERWIKEELPRDPFERAVRWFFLNRSGISKGNSEAQPKTGWRHSTKSNQNPASGYINACHLIEQFAKRMQGVMIEKTDFRTIITKYDSPDTLFYVDPPYVDREKFYALTDEDKENPIKLHEDLAELLNNIQGKAIVSYYEDPLIEKLYEGWNMETFKAYKQVVGGDGKGSEAEEILLMNFNNDQLSIFDIKG